jgi:DNA-binding SARP family transcriptional activator/tetratricopeptide (TPR) repeat protein/AAA+ ATPase superfamily predicted ATPase
MSIKIQVIGTPFIEVDGEKLFLPLKKAEALIYYLAVEGKTSREKLTCLLWGEKDELSAQNNFRNALYLLKRYLPLNFIISDRHAVSLGEADIDLEKVASIKDISVPIPSYICDELLKGFDIPENAEFGEWLIAAKTLVKEKITESLKIRVASCYDAEDPDKLQESLEKLVSLDPFDEDSALELMDLYCKRRGAVKAAAFFREYKTKLKNEIGLTPSKRAEDLFRRMIITETGSNENVIKDNPESFFFGREKELELILNKIEEGQEKPAVIFVEGEAGVGKTALVHRIISPINNDKSMMFSTMSYEDGLGYPYSPWNNLVSQVSLYADIEKLDSAALNISLLAGVFPNFMSNRRITYNADFVKMSERTPFVIGSAISKLLTLVSTGSRLILLIEDLHWFDKQSLLLLEALLTTLSIPSVIFITSRPEKSEYALRMLQRIETSGLISLQHISLKPFDKRETQSFCRLFLDKKLIESRDSDYFFRESEGLPLLIVEIIKTLRSNSDAELASGGLGGVILARLGEIPEKHRDFLRVLSVFTSGAQISTISEIMEERTVQVAAVAEELLHRKLIKETETLEGNVFVDFQHPKVRESVYNLTPAFQREEYHMKAAAILNRKYSPQIWDPALSSLICYHYTKAGLLKNVLHQHLREMIFDITLNHDLFPLIQDDVLFSCSHPFSDRADTERKMDEVSELLHTLNRKDPDDPEVLKMEALYLELRGGYLIGWGEYREGQIFINRALQMAKKYSFHNINIHCLMHMGHHFLQTDNWGQLLNCAREMLHIAKGEEREKYIGIALRFIGVAFQIKGDFVRSEKVLRRSIEIFEEQALMGKHYTLSMLAAECYIGENYQWQGMFDKALEHFEKCTRTCERKGLFWGCSHFHAHVADVAFDMNNMDMMYEHIYKGAEIFEKCQGGRCGSILYSLKAIADAKQGKYDQALRSLEIGELLSSPIRKRSWIAVHAMAKACLAEMKENHLLPSEFDNILVKSAREYSDEAAEIYSQIPVPHRQKMLEGKIGLSK